MTRLRVWRLEGPCSCRSLTETLLHFFPLLIAAVFADSFGECQAIPSPQEELLHTGQRQAPKYAFVQLAYDPPEKVRYEQLFRILPMALAIKRWSSYPLVLLTNETQLPDGQDLARALQPLNVQVLPLEEVTVPSKLGATFKYKYWLLAFWKIQVWKLTQFDKIIWLDSDTIITRSIDSFFNKPWMWAQPDNWVCRPNIPKVCSGLLSLVPNRSDFDGMLAYAGTLEALQYGDQELISLYFRNVRNRPIQLLSDTEAVFGNCLPQPPLARGGKGGRRPGVLIDQDGNPVKAPWLGETPAFIHKSSRENACFNHDFERQERLWGKNRVAACVENPLGVLWRELYCEATATINFSSRQTRAFCHPECWRSRRDCPKA